MRHFRGGLILQSLLPVIVIHSWTLAKTAAKWPKLIGYRIFKYLWNHLIDLVQEAKNGGGGQNIGSEKKMWWELGGRGVSCKPAKTAILKFFNLLFEF